MKFRPCIDLHSGQVKQIVGSTLLDKKEETPASLATNFETDRPAASYAEMYQKDALEGGHVIMLGKGNDESAKSALAAYPNGLQVGGGINTSNAKEWLDAGASHVIVTSFVFHGGEIDMKRLSDLVAITGKENLVLDLSCRRKPDDPTGPYYVVTDRWQTYTDVKVNSETLELLSSYCDEFLVHGVENEGKRCGILEDLVLLLGEYSPIPVTYAGGVKDITDLERVKSIGMGKVDLTIGSALDCFGGSISYDDVIEWHKKENKNE
jgi:phosphoribosylformimino-5-aminoimidazole carboxamide ribotide isomerase